MVCVREEEVRRGDLWAIDYGRVGLRLVRAEESSLGRRRCETPISSPPSLSPPSSFISPSLTLTLHLGQHVEIIQQMS